MVTQENLGRIQKRVRSPRSAALAGIIFSGLLVASMLLVTRSAQVPFEEINPEWLDERVESVSLGLGLIPFAGIAFLWFTGVIRDHIGDREDRFFATVFLGSGIAFVVLIFIYAAILGAIFGTYALASTQIADNDVYIFGFMLVNEVVGNYTLRMAGVYMFSIGTIWTRAEVTPRWLSLITYLLALIFLFFAGAIREARFVFPAWVLLTSIFILITNRRLEQAEEPA